MTRLRQYSVDCTWPPPPHKSFPHLQSPLTPPTATTHTTHVSERSREMQRRNQSDGANDKCAEDGLLPAPGPERASHVVAKVPIRGLVCSCLPHLPTHAGRDAQHNMWSVEVFGALGFWSSGRPFSHTHPISSWERRGRARGRQQTQGRRCYRHHRHRICATHTGHTQGTHLSEKERAQS